MTNSAVNHDKQHESTSDYNPSSDIVPNQTASDTDQSVTDLARLQENASWWDSSGGGVTSGNEVTSDSKMTSKAHDTSSSAMDRCDISASDAMETDFEETSSNRGISESNSLQNTPEKVRAMTANASYWGVMSTDNTEDEEGEHQRHHVRKFSITADDPPVAMETEDVQPDTSPQETNVTPVAATVSNEQCVAKESGLAEDVAGAAPVHQSGAATGIKDNGAFNRSDQCTYEQQAQTDSRCTGEMNGTSDSSALKSNKNVENIFDALNSTAASNNTMEMDVSLSDILEKRKQDLAKTAAQQTEMMETLKVLDTWKLGSKKPELRNVQSDPVNAEGSRSPVRSWPVFNPTGFRIPKKNPAGSSPLRRQSSDSPSVAPPTTPPVEAGSSTSTFQPDELLNITTESTVPDDTNPKESLKPSTSANKPSPTIPTLDDYIKSMKMKKQNSQPASDIPMEDEDNVDDDDDDDLPEFNKISKGAVATTSNKKSLDNITPTKIFTPVIESPALNRLGTPAKLKSTDVFSLETLHAEKLEQMSEAGQLYCMKELTSKEKLKQGGFRQIIQDCEDQQGQEVELSREEKEQLKRLENDAATIVIWPPGDERFKTDLKERFFDSKISLRQCGFKQGSSIVDKHLAKANTEQMKVLLSGDILCIGFRKISCKEAFLFWLFNITAVHEKEDVVRSTHRLIYQILANCGVEWVPSLADITRVMLNFGTRLEELYPPSCHLDFNETDLQLVNEDKNSKEPSMESRTSSSDKIQNGNSVSEDDGNELKYLNLQCIVQTISLCCQRTSHLYSSKDLKMLIFMMCRISLDRYLVKGVVLYDIQVCLQELLDKFEEAEWSDRLYDLCFLLKDVTEHHHNRLYLAKLFPATQRGKQLQRSLAYTLLLASLPEPPVGENTDISEEEDVKTSKLPKREEICNFKLSCLIHVISNLLNRPLPPEEYYLVSSLVQLIDISVGSETLPKRERPSLVSLEVYLRQLNSCIRDNCHNLDTSTIKDLIQRTISKWTFLLRDMGKTQKTLFDHYQVCPKKEETLMVEKKDNDEDEEDQVAIPDDNVSVESELATEI